jgi:hypothetical protein
MHIAFTNCGNNHQYIFYKCLTYKILAKIHKCTNKILFLKSKPSFGWVNASLLTRWLPQESRGLPTWTNPSARENLRFVCVYLM